MEAFIGVFDEDIPKMKKLGYQVQYNSCRPKDEDSFKPKFIKIKKESYPSWISVIRGMGYKIIK